MVDAEAVTALLIGHDQDHIRLLGQEGLTSCSGGQATPSSVESNIVARPPWLTSGYVCSTGTGDDDYLGH
jgi:hypothetical protein